MVSGSLNNYDFSLFHLKVVAKQPSHPLHAKLDRLIREIKKDLTQTQSISLKQLIEKKLGEIFEFRLDTLKWMAIENPDFQEMLRDEIAPFLENMSKVNRFQPMVNHIMLALSVMEVVVGNLQQPKSDLSDSSDLSVQNFANPTLEQFIYFTTTLPNQEQGRYTKDWIICSLYIEYLILATVIMYEEKLIVPEINLMQMTSLLGETTQAYASLAELLNLIEIRFKDSSKIQKISKGASIFKRILNEKNEIHRHLKSGGVLADLKDKFNFANPLYFTGR